jgi:four helix bundle protein
MRSSVVEEKSYVFAKSIVKLCYSLSSVSKEFVLSKQLLRSGTSIGANIREASQAQSKADFLSKTSISLKEANESLYWLELLFDTNFIDKEKYDECSSKCIELIKILTSIIKTTKLNLRR